MSDTPGDRPDPLRAWLEATGGDQSQAAPESGGNSTGQLRRLLTMTAAVCVVAVVLAGLAGQRLGSRQPSSSPSATPPAATPQALATGSPALPSPAPAGTAALPDDPAVAAAALLAVRTGAGAQTYVDTAAVESVEHVAGAALVTVTALVLRQVRGGWSPAEPARFVVPVDTAAGTAAALATPWRLPASDVAAPRPEWHEVDDDALRDRAASAAAAAGYSSIGSVRVRRTDDLPDVLSVTLHGVAVGERDGRDHELWLTSDAGRVLGAPAMASVPMPGAHP